MRYLLTAKGREAFPRHYSLLADKVIAFAHKSFGPDGVKTMMTAMGTEARMENRLECRNESASKMAGKLAQILQLAGYEASAPNAEVAEVVAYNCVFHHLASRYKEVCEYDLAFIREATGMAVEHSECMVGDGHACRFRLKPKIDQNE